MSEPAATTPEPVKFEFNDSEAKLIKSYVKDGFSRLSIARSLRSHLEGRNIIEDDATYEEIILNKPLMEALPIIIAASLPTTALKSQFGLGKFSDYEIYHQARNDDGLNLLIKGNKSFVKSY